MRRIRRRGRFLPVGFRTFASVSIFRRIIAGHGRRIISARGELAARTGADHRKAAWAPVAALDFLARAGADLFFRVLFAAVPDQRSHWTKRNPAGCGLSASSERRATCPELLDRANSAVVRREQRRVDDAVLGGAGCVAAGHREPVAARVTAALFPLLCFFRERRAGFFRLSIGWHAAGGGLHRAIFRARGLAAGTRSGQSTFAREPVPAAVGMVSHLFRIGRGENRKRRPGMAAIHRDGRLLSERPAADVDRVVRAAPAALVSRFGDFLHAADGIADRVDAVSTEEISHRLFFYCDAVRDFDYRDGELYVSELSGVAARGAAAGRLVSGMGSAAALPRIHSREELDDNGDCVRSCGTHSGTPERSRGMAREIYAVAQAVRRRLFGTGLLFHHGAAPVDVCARAAAAGSASAGAGAISRHRYVWPVREDDPRALRDRISGHAGRQDVAHLSISLQAASA